MKKYKSALSDIMCCVPYGKLKEQEEILKELVDRATPKKVKDKKWTNGEFISLSYGKCPSCGAEAWGCDDDYCPKCGQALDWKIEVKEDVD